MLLLLLSREISCFPLLNSRRFLTALSFSLSRSLWMMPATPPSFIWTAKLWRVHPSHHPGHYWRGKAVLATGSIPEVNYQWLASTWNLCHWSQSLKPGISDSFQSTPLSISPARLHQVVYGNVMETVAKNVLMKFRVVILLLLSPPQDLNSIIPWSLQPRPLTLTSLSSSSLFKVLGPSRLHPPWSSMSESCH